MPRKTDSNNPADWLAIADSEVEALQVLTEREVAYDRLTEFRATLEQVTDLLEQVRARVS